MITDGEESPSPSVGILDLVRRHKRAFVAVNTGYYGFVLLGMFIAGVNPAVRDFFLEGAKQAVTAGPLRSIGEAYGEGKFLLAFAATFIINLVAGSFLSITVPSAIIPFSGLLLAAWRALLWGFLFSPIDHPLGVGLFVHYGTLLLEGQAYVLTAFAAYLHGRSFLAPHTMGAATNGQGYALGVRLSARVYVIITITLLVAALYESFTGVYIIPLLVTK